MNAALGPRVDVFKPCDHNCIPCRGGWRLLFRRGWVCIRCDSWFRGKPDA